MTMRTGMRCLAVLAVAGLAGPLVAQGGPAIPPNRSAIARADALLKAGRIEAAEAVYYREARRRPRDPVARLALGRYLAARGATRVGAVLIEEARFFGTSPAVAAVYLAPLYARLNDFKALALLPAAPLTVGERARAEWLAKQPPSVVGPDSVTLGLARTTSETIAVLGEVTLVIDGDSLNAVIDPAVRGIILDTSWAKRPSVRVFPGATTGVQAGVSPLAGVALRARLAALTFANLPVTLEPLPPTTGARIGLDMLARFSPTFRPGEGQLTLRRSGRVPRVLPGERVPLFVEPTEAWVVWNGRREPLLGDVVARRLRSARWTLDARRGEIVLHS